MNMKSTFVGIVSIGCVIGAVAFLPSVGEAQDAKVKDGHGTPEVDGQINWGRQKLKELIPLAVSKYPLSISALLR